MDFEKALKLVGSNQEEDPEEFFKAIRTLVDHQKQLSSDKNYIYSSISHQLYSQIARCQQHKEEEAKRQKILAGFKKLNLQPGDPVYMETKYSIYSYSSNKYTNRVWVFFKEFKNDYLHYEFEGNPQSHSLQIERISKLKRTSYPFPVAALYSREQLYERAQKLGLEGRSKLTKRQLRAALVELENKGITPQSLEAEESSAFICD